MPLKPIKKNLGWKLQTPPKRAFIQPENSYQKFAKKAQREGIDPQTIGVYRSMGLSMEKALEIETNKLWNLENKRVGANESPKLSIEQIKEIARTNIQRMYGK